MKQLVLITIICCITLIVGMAAVFSREADTERLVLNFDSLNICAVIPWVAPDGTIYYAAEDRDSNWDLFVAFTPEGREMWRVETYGLVEYPPAIAPDGTLFFGDERGYFYSVDNDGGVNRRHELGYHIHASPAIGPDGTVYVGCQDGFLYAFDSDGRRQLWKCLIGKGMENSWLNIESPPAVGSDGTIYVACKDGRIYAVTPWGTIKWTFTADHFFSGGSPSIGRDGTIYAASHGHRLYAINPDGSLQWEYYTGTCGYSTPVIDSDGTIYVGSNDSGIRSLFAVNPDGTLKWQYQAEGPIYTSPVIGNDCTIYATDTTRNIYAFDPDGSLLWINQYVLGKAAVTSMVGTDSILNTDENPDNHYDPQALIHDNRGSQVDAPWPNYMHNNTRSVATEPPDIPTLYLVDGGIMLQDLTQIPDVTVSIDGLTTETNEYGYYSFHLPDGSYTLDIDYTHSDFPTRHDIIVDGKNVTVNFLPQQNRNVQGRLMDADGPLAGVTVSAGGISCTTDDEGRYSFELTSGEYTVEFDVGEESFPRQVDVVVTDEDVELRDVCVNRRTWHNEFIDGFSGGFTVLSDGSLWMFDGDDNVVILNNDGTLRRRYETGFPWGSLAYTPSWNEDGTCYMPWFTGVNAYSPEGELVWSFVPPETGFGASPAIGEDALYMGTKKCLYALDFHGNLLWRYQTDANVGGSPSIAGDGTIYFSCYDNHVYALNPDGSLKWRYGATHVFSPTPVIGHGGMVYVGGYDGAMHAIRPDGTAAWTFQTETAISRPALVSADGTIYFTNQHHRLFALNPDGSLKWEYSDDTWISLRIGLTSGDVLLGTVGLAHRVSLMVAFDLEGNLLWKHQFAGTEGVSGPVIDDNGTLFMCMYTGWDGMWLGYVSAYRTPFTGYQDNAPWPCDMANNHRTGKAEANEPVYVADENGIDTSASAQTPAHVTLHANIPNPFNPVTAISFTVREPVRVNMQVYNIAGMRVAELADGMFSPGRHTVSWHAGRFASGVYLCVLEAGGKTAVRKMLLMR